MMMRKLNKGLRYFVLIFLSFLCLFSFYALIINATRAHSQIQQGFSFLPGDFFIRNLNKVLANENLPVLKGIRNSLLVSSLSAILSTYFSVLTAFAIHTYEFRFKRIIFTFIMMIMMVPPQVSALGFIRWMSKLGLIDTLTPLFLPSIAAPIIFYFMLSYMQSNLPKAVVEAARMDGSSEFRTFNLIVLPIMKPAIAVQAIFTFVSSWNNYFIPALIIRSADKKTMPILIAQLRSADFLKFDMGQVYVLIFLAIVPIILVYILLSKYIVRGVAVGSVKG